MKKNPLEENIPNNDRATTPSEMDEMFYSEVEKLRATHEVRMHEKKGGMEWSQAIVRRA